jgi:two-component system, LytTR family, response regulator
MSNIRCIIVDDEPKSREVLKSLLENFCEGVEVIGMAGDILQAVAEIKAKKPQLVFLDISLKEGDSFQILEHFQPIPFEMIFVTAYDEYSVRALTYAGIKCLFKPLDIDELQSAIDETKAKPGFAHLAYEMANGIIKSQFTRIPVATKEGLSFLPVSSILFVLAKDGKSEIYFENNHKMKSDRSLEEFSLLITSENFIQLGRDIIINKPQIISELTQPECLFFKDGSKLESDKKIVNELLRNLL